MHNDQLMGPGFDNISAAFVAQQQGDALLLEQYEERRRVSAAFIAQQQGGALLLEHHEELRSAFAYLLPG